MDFRSARGAVVVLDATEIARDWYLGGLEYRLLRFLAREAGLQPRVPASVVSEVIANHAREYTKARRAYLKAAAEMRRAGGPAVRLADVPKSQDYGAFLRQRLEAAWIEVLDEPSALHQEVVARAVARRPPFDETGTGYRDTLTWLSCLDLAREGERVFLVSQDRDFAGRDLELAPELAGELVGLPGSVNLVRDLREWLTPLSPWRDVTDPREAAALARDEEVASLFAPWDMFEDPRLSAAEFGLPPGATIESVSYHSSEGLDRVRHSKNADGADLVVYRFTIKFEVELSLRVWEAAEAGLPLERRPADPSEIQRLTTVVPMTGYMTVVHDERDVEAPLYFDLVEFEPGYVYPATAREDDPEQLRLPFGDD